MDECRKAFEDWAEQELIPIDQSEPMMPHRNYTLWVCWMAAWDYRNKHSLPVDGICKCECNSTIIAVKHLDPWSKVVCTECGGDVIVPTQNREPIAGYIDSDGKCHITHYKDEPTKP